MTRRRIEPVRFRWIDWNRDKVLAHGLATPEVEFAWRRGLIENRKRRDGSFETLGRIPSGRLIRIIWHWNEVFDALEPGGTSKVVFVVTAYKAEP